MNAVVLIFFQRCPQPSNEEIMPRLGAAGYVGGLSPKTSPVEDNDIWDWACWVQVPPDYPPAAVNALVPSVCEALEIPVGTEVGWSDPTLVEKDAEGRWVLKEKN